METKINIAEILRDKPVNTKLYSPLFGDVYFSHVKDSIINVKHHTGESKFLNSGRYYNYVESEPLLFPSKEMRDWSKFAWKKGDVLVSDDGSIEVIFDKWYDDTYTSFYCKHYLDSEDENDIRYLEEFICSTWKYSLEDTESFLCYVTNIEERLGGKLNFETLEIEKQPEFKDGDIVTMHKKNGDIVFIFNRLRIEGSFYYYAFHALQTNNTGVIDCHITLPCAWTFFEGKMNFATDSKKQQLFDALAKKGKAWDAEKKMIVNLKPKIELKPFEKVLVRNRNTQRWNVDLFGFKSDGVNVFYHCVGSSWNFCIPYIGNESLLGTTDNFE